MALKSERPSSARGARSKAIETRVPEKRVVADVPEGVHVGTLVFCVQHGLQMRHLVAVLLEQTCVQQQQRISVPEVIALAKSRGARGAQGS